MGGPPYSNEGGPLSCTPRRLHTPNQKTSSCGFGAPQVAAAAAAAASAAACSSEAYSPSQGPPGAPSDTPEGLTERGASHPSRKRRTQGPQDKQPSEGPLEGPPEGPLGGPPEGPLGGPPEVGSEGPPKGPLKELPGGPLGTTNHQEDPSGGAPVAAAGGPPVAAAGGPLGAGFRLSMNLLAGVLEFLELPDFLRCLLVSR